MTAIYFLLFASMRLFQVTSAANELAKYDAFKNINSKSAQFDLKSNVKNYTECGIYCDVDIDCVSFTYEKTGQTYKCIMYNTFNIEVATNEISYYHKKLNNTIFIGQGYCASQFSTTPAQNYYPKGFTSTKINGISPQTCYQLCKKSNGCVGFDLQINSGWCRLLGNSIEYTPEISVGNKSYI